MTLKEFSEDKAVRDTWAKVGPVLIRFLENRALEMMTKWKSSDFTAAKAHALAELRRDLLKVGTPDTESSVPKMQALLPEQ